MSLLELLKTRCSVRKFHNKPIEMDKINLILEAARVAPSACNNQPWHFIVLNNNKTKEKVTNKWGTIAPLLIIACANHKISWKRKDQKDHADIDIAIAVDHMILQATELGIGSCWVCAFDKQKIINELNLPEYIEPVVVIPFGYPQEQSAINRHLDERKNISEITSWNDYNEKV